jgi:hypothetical protein
MNHNRTTVRRIYAFRAFKAIVLIALSVIAGFWLLLLWVEPQLGNPGGIHRRASVSVCCVNILDGLYIYVLFFFRVSIYVVSILAVITAGRGYGRVASICLASAVSIILPWEKIVCELYCPGTWWES